MWTVMVTKAAAKAIRKLPVTELEKYTLWLNIVAHRTLAARSPKPGTASGAASNSAPDPHALLELEKARIM
ncbi:MAG: hypothetical protein ACRELY_25355 [Polyangiaceae bacterium]